ncbi:MAG: hypothetical protein ACREDO_01825 [Methyloceanibacter sp.]
MQLSLLPAPKQRVTEMVLSLRYVTLGQDAAVSWSPPKTAEPRRGCSNTTSPWRSQVEGPSRDALRERGCSSAEGIGCGVECDGGGIEIEPLKDEDGAILVRLERIRMSLGCSEGEDVELEAGDDDRVFKLMKAPAEVCTAMQTAADNLSQ